MAGPPCQKAVEWARGSNSGLGCFSFYFCIYMRLFFQFISVILHGLQFTLLELSMKRPFAFYGPLGISYTCRTLDSGAAAVAYWLGSTLKAEWMP